MALTFACVARMAGAPGLRYSRAYQCGEGTQTRAKRKLRKKIKK
ncbi:hypothetical protein S144_14 [Shewanella sp. phage 1/44]|nr:hypothetical protein S144_14 [Shewanella sp. phage 1/44]AHK11790.1 hypothetical protein S144_14 [Shewanella sp. phage 1/44]